MAQLPDERRRALLDHVLEVGPIDYPALADALGVSVMTVRRDAESLADEQLLERVRGGVRPPDPLREPTPAEKRVLHPGRKHGIARAARELVRPGAVLGIGAGTTTLAFARAIADVPDLTVVTNAIPIADALSVLPPERVVLTGGTRTVSDALVGPVADQALAGMHLDLAVLGCHGFDAAAGFTAPNLQEAATDRRFLERATSGVVLADASKWGTRGLTSFASLDEIDVLVSDATLPSDAALDRIMRVVRAG
ncbi:DeoR/GlpR transcriptional regulator [Pseudoclavibacter chungangensis]|uniref:DeoR/GlpR transcriptional regulator n=1 Tax=Pseudoclavibacter chungangensis TaxID=587635 RepID=A0A7J5BNP4_9MICO|nr:DeoR/GlpR family DNA-binding transcription regulator [Pseudoclavibacter chungangensis]KAB1653813.1 DeoR/GlpR transcriptional regulator [Pseudoclavibacter chungangensis]NYJ68180.1 DeoR/GlpR family transcriptional regulator of sugar metabolism [Pseudoclavibacter chungangensis]